ncbi:MAG: sedoheptulokinase [Bacillota bacterium]
MTVISLDIGTSKICAAAINADSGSVEEIIEVSNSFVATEAKYEKVQDAVATADIAERLCRKLARKYRPILCIGITGQMHGILYLNKNGNAVSPLYTWQDESGLMQYKNGCTYADYLTRNSNYNMATGFGLTTCFFHTQTGVLPKDAAQLCTVQDYVAMRLTGRKKSLVHVTNAASIGFFNLEKGEFDKAVIGGFGIDVNLLPDVVGECAILGETAEGIPVAVPIGDNQASFLGSVDKVEECVLANIGTGSQVSIAIDGILKNQYNGLELRPFLYGKNLLTGSPLCGGRAYALLESFFRDVVKLAGVKKANSLYSRMNSAIEGINSIDNPLLVTTKFCGARDNPGERGKIENISFDNFTPLHLIAGFLDGIAQELYELVQPVFSVEGKGKKRLIVSGNGVRKNPVLAEILSRKFAMPVQIPVHREEAAYGAVLYAMTGVGRFRDIAEAQKIIKYRSNEDSINVGGLK